MPLNLRDKLRAVYGPRRPTAPVKAVWVPQQAQTSAPGMVTIRTCPSISFLER